MTEPSAKAQRWAGRTPRLAAAHLSEALEYRRRLSEIASIPSQAELAKRWGVSVSTVRNYLRGPLPKRMSEDV